MASQNVDLVYGGGRIGLMGVVADAVIAGGGKATGIIPRHLYEAEVGHEGLSELRVVDDMHARKQTMFQLADAFIVLPGGIGTVEEMVEVLTWRYLRLHDKPIVLLNVADYWRPLVALFQHFITHEFAGPEMHQLFTVVDDVDDVVDVLQRLHEPQVEPHPERI